MLKKVWQVAGPHAMDPKQLKSKGYIQNLIIDWPVNSRNRNSAAGLNISHTGKSTKVLIEFVLNEEKKKSHMNITFIVKLLI